MRISNRWLRRGRSFLLFVLEGVLVICIVRIALVFFQDKGELLSDSIRWLFR